MREAASQVTSGRREISPLAVFSTLLSFLVLVLACFMFADNPRKWNEPRSILGGLAAVDVGYTGILLASGIGYVLFQKEWTGIVHAALMTGVSFFCITHGAATLNDKSVMGGRGPDANPVAGVSYGVAAGAVALGILCAGFALALWIKTIRSVPDKPVYPIQR